MVTRIKAVSGVILCVDKGVLAAYCGLVRPEDQKRAANNAARSGDDSAEGTSEVKAKAEYSEKLTCNLTAHRTVAIQAVLAERPDVALVVITHHLSLSVFYFHTPSAVQISVRQANPTQHAPELPETPAGKALEALRTEWERTLPDEEGELFSWLLQQSREEVMRLLAFCTATTIDTVSGDANQGIGKAFPYMTALGLDMADWWTPTKSTYFDHVKKTKALETIERAVSVEAALPLHKMKKAQLGETAERLIAGTRWLPSVMRWN